MVFVLALFRFCSSRERNARQHLNDVLRIYVDHYNRARPHRGLDLTIPDSPRPAVNEPAHLSAIARRDRLGGLIHEYDRAA
jgi:putative transposase